jgi:hypothetical protein
MTMPTGPLSPYVTPEILTAAPTGISWSTIPPGRNVTDAQRYAEQSNICARATAMVDLYCNQVLRATLDNEVLRGPGFRVRVLNGSGNGRAILSRWPVIGVSSIQVAASNIFPHQWITVPDGYYEPDVPPIGLYGTVAPAGDAQGGQAIIIAPGYVNWCNGRDGIVLSIDYYNGWPHCGLTTAAEAGTTTLVVDDTTGWAITSAFSGVTGATGTIYDAGQQEVVQVTATSTASGPGTLTLASATAFSHAAGVIVSTLPQSVIWAATMYGASVALTRGSTATTVQSIPGASSSTGGVKSASDMTGDAQTLLNPFKRVI